MIVGFMSVHFADMTWQWNILISSLEVHRHSCANDVSFPDSYLEVYSPSVLVLGMGRAQLHLWEVKKLC